MFPMCILVIIVNSGYLIGEVFEVSHGEQFDLYNFFYQISKFHAQFGHYYLQ